MDEQNNAPAEQTAAERSELLRIRRDKLAALQAEGRDPFLQIRFDRTHNSAEISAQFDALENQDVAVAGRIMAKLLIVESPAKAKTITKYLGGDYQVKASMGHLRDLPKKSLGVDVDHDFAPDYQPIEGKDKIIRELRAAADEADCVYLATDPDREGEAISWHLRELLDLPDSKTRRVTFNEITKHAVTEAVQKPRDIDMLLLDSGANPECTPEYLLQFAYMGHYFMVR